MTARPPDETPKPERGSGRAASGSSYVVRSVTREPGHQRPEPAHARKARLARITRKGKK